MPDRDYTADDLVRAVAVLATLRPVERDEPMPKYSDAEIALLDVTAALNNAIADIGYIDAHDPRSWRQFFDLLESLNLRALVAGAIIEADFPNVRKALRE